MFVFSSIHRFFSDTLWILQDQQLKPLHAVLIKSLRIILLSAQGFVKDLCSLRASALTLYSLLSIVPVIALLFGIAKGFGFEQMLRKRLLDQSPEQGEMMQQIIGFAEKMLANTQGGVVAGVGVIILFWSVIKVIGNIEESFNQIWKIPKNRTLARKLSDYLSMMMLAPVLLIASSSLTVFIKTQVTWLIGWIHLPDFGTRIVLYLLSFLPWLIMMMLFSFILIFMPNRKIDFKAGLIAGIITGVLYQWMQWAYLSLQFALSSYNAIYGSFAALPLFLIWLQLGWFIVLYGCEIAFYIQNYDSYCHNQRFSGLSSFLHKTVALKIIHSIVLDFVQGGKALGVSELSKMLELPLPVVQKTVFSLEACELIVALAGEDESEPVYHPGFDVHQMTVAQVITRLEYAGINQLPSEDQLSVFADLLKKWYSLLETSEHNRLLKDFE